MKTQKKIAEPARILPGRRCAGARQAGYALLLVMFLAATVFIAMAVAFPSLLTESRRQKEEELIWRGEQYERAIRSYFRKNGRFPAKLEDLTKGTNGIHFLRKPYKDPMNTADGSWRLIYVTPSGQLIGSVRFNSLLQMGVALNPNSQLVNPPGQPGAGTPTQPATPQQPQTTPPSPGTTTTDATGGGATPLVSPPQPSLPNPCGALAPSTSGSQGSQTSTTQGTSGSLSDQSPVFGGSIIGIASKVDRASIKVYNCGRKYREWEFIWNPTAQAQLVIQPGALPVVPAGANPKAPPQNPPQPPLQQNPMQ